jgi:hypothetical protein
VLQNLGGRCDFKSTRLRSSQPSSGSIRIHAAGSHGHNLFVVFMSINNMSFEGLPVRIKKAGRSAKGTLLKSTYKLRLPFKPFTALRSQQYLKHPCILQKLSIYPPTHSNIRAHKLPVQTLRITAPQIGLNLTNLTSCFLPPRSIGLFPLFTQFNERGPIHSVIVLENYGAAIFVEKLRDGDVVG